MTTHETTQGAPDAAAVRGAARSASETARVLVVDDERFFREVIRELLEAQGLEVVLARDAREALDAAEDPSIGVVVLDIQLPDESGLEVLGALRARRPELRVVMLSAHTDQEYVLEALRHGACDYLAKPLHDEELRLAVGRALEAFDVLTRFAALRSRLDGLAEALEQLHAGAEPEEPEALAGRLAEAAGRLLGAGKTSVLLRDETGERLRVVAAAGRKQRPEELDPVPIGRGVAGLAVASGEAIVVDDIERDERVAPAPAGRYESRACAALPLGGARAFGALCVTDRRGGAPFREEDVALLRVLAAAGGALLDPARPLGDPLGPLLEEPEAAAPAPAPAAGEPVAAEPAAAAGADADAALARAVCEAMTTEVEPERLLGAALAAVAARLEAAPIAIHLLDAEGGALRREAQWTGEGGGDREHLPLGLGATGLAFDEGRALASEGPGADPRASLDVDTPEDGAPGPIWVLPLRFRGRTLGVCRVFPRRPAALPDHTGELLAAALSAAVRNVLLYRSLVESIEEVAEVRREAAAGREGG